ncbi:MAG: phosphoglucomutase [Ignavibacteriales bacterium]|nr:MAG: phosphoglucomutase [Ignavibacteriales bacterium]
MKIIFGTDGWRGLLDSEINEETISLVAQSFADYNLQRFSHPAIAIGFDGRRNSEKFAKIFAETLSGNNIKVFLSDRIIPTPVLSFFVKHNNLNSGVMITASHNPPEYNGVKFKADYGGPFLTEETLKVEELIGKSSVKKNDVNIERTNFLLSYTEQIGKFIDFEFIRRSRLNVLIDSMGGAGSDYLERILLAHNISAQTIFSLPDQNFYGRLAEPIEKNLGPLKKELQENDYSLGLATDGDADRCGVMLDNGEWLSAQETILFLTNFIVNTKKLQGNIVKTASVTDKLKTLFESKQRKIYDVQVGFKYITEVMISKKIAFGCEESGGFGYGIHLPERDGILSSLFMIEMLAHSGFNKLSEYVNHKREEFGKIFYDRIDLKYEKQDRNELLPGLYRNFIDRIGNFRVVHIKAFYSSRNVINGLKFFLEGDNRWLLLRSSETEPIVRIYAEGQSDDEVKKFLEYGRKLFN